MANASIADILKAAQENIALVAEAEVRLAASGQTSLSTWEKQSRALEFLNGRLKQQAEQTDKLGKGAKTLQDAFKGVQSSMLTATATLTGTFFELRHLSGAAHPGYIRAFDGALGLLQARLGGALLPVFDAVIDTVMDAADWFDSLSDGAKKLVAGGMVAIPAAIGLGTALRALSPVLMLAAAATKRFTAAAKENAAISAAGGIGAVAGVVGILYSMGVFDNYDHSKHEHDTGPVTEREFREGGRAFGREFDEIMRLAPEARAAEARQRAERLRAMAAEERTHWYIPSSVPESREQRAAMYERIAAQGISTNEEESARKKVQRQAMRVSAMNQENQPRYSALSEARKNLQLQILGKDRYQQEILREQRKHRLEEIKRLDELIKEFRSKFPNAHLYG